MENGGWFNASAEYKHLQACRVVIDEASIVDFTDGVVKYDTSATMNLKFQSHYIGNCGGDIEYTLNWSHSETEEPFPIEISA